MRLFTQQVFNSTIQGTTAVYSQPQYNSLLGSGDQLAVQVVCSRSSGTSPTITVIEQISNDGERWADKTTMLSAQALSTTAVDNLFRYDDGASPMASFVRFQITLGGTSPSSDVLITVCGRSDQGS